MNPYSRWYPLKAAPYALVLLYLLLAYLHPSHWNTPLLGLAVYAAARGREVAGGVVAALVAGAAALFGLWRLGGTAVFHDSLIVSGYAWAWVATHALGISVGHLTRHSRMLDLVNADLRRAQQRLTALHSIALSLSATLDVHLLLEVMLEQLGTLWGYNFGAVLLHDDKTNELVIAAARGYLKQPGERIPVEGSLCGYVLATGRPLCIANVHKEDRYISGIEGACSELAVPLIWEDVPIGVLNVESPVPCAYGPSDVTLLTTVAEQASAAIGNARLHQETRHLAITDANTGLYNYRYFQEKVTAVVREAQLTGGNCALMMLDLDFFKRCNDTYGHPTGDAILQQVATLLRDSCRQGDLAFRYGGEEFVVLLPGSNSRAACVVAERIRERIAGNTFQIQSGRPLDFQLTVSLGVAAYPQDALTASDLLLAADNALYAAKTNGRDRVVLASEVPHYTVQS